MQFACKIYMKLFSRPRSIVRLLTNVLTDRAITGIRTKPRGIERHTSYFALNGTSLFYNAYVALWRAIAVKSRYRDIMNDIMISA